VGLHAYRQLSHHDQLARRRRHSHGTVRHSVRQRLLRVRLDHPGAGARGHRLQFADHDCSVYRHFPLHGALGCVQSLGRLAQGLELFAVVILTRARTIQPCMKSI
jgi:hypothetical protein